MKSTYRARWGHERDRSHKKNRNSRTRNRLMTVLDALQSDIATGFLRINKQRSEIKLSPEQITRIKSEIAVLQSKV